MLTSAECEPVEGVFMAIDEFEAAAASRKYFHTDIPLAKLGWGVSGRVYLAPNSRVAMKVHRAFESFNRELACYHILRKQRIDRLLGLIVPKLRGWRTADSLSSWTLCILHTYWTSREPCSSHLIFRTTPEQDGIAT
jgi:hypothetical protein